MQKKRVTMLAKALTMIMVVGFVLISTVPAQAASYPLLKVGSKGKSVSQLQEALKNKGYFTYPKVTDYYGTITKDAVIRFQKDHGLSVDGLAGPKTQAALYESNSDIKYTGLQYYAMSNERVKDIQNALKSKGYFCGTATGCYGHVTEDAVVAFQIDNGLRIDGIVGPETHNALFNGKSKSVSNKAEETTTKEKPKTTATTTNTTADRNTTTADQRNDIFWLARIIHAESEGESYAGKVAVGSVIMNRVKSNQFPSDIYNIIFEYYLGIPQFSPVQDGTIYNNPNADSLKAAEEAYWGNKPVGDALYFFNPQKAAGSWIVNNRQYVATVGNHSFYR